MPKKSMNNKQLMNKVSKLIVKYERKNGKQEKILKISKKTEKDLKELLEEIPKESNKEFNPELSEQLVEIHKNFKSEMRKIKEETKKQRKEFKNSKKLEKKEKYSKKGEKSYLKEEKSVKKEKKLLLKSSRVKELPEVKENGLESLTVIIDGWNISGCDKIARKAMRGKKSKGAKRMINLLKHFGFESEFMKSNGKNVNLEIHFDGKGKSRVEEFGSLLVLVKYSGKEETVSDRLIRELTSNSSNSSKYLVVTSNKDLTLNLNKIGVKCMTSGCFYKKYLKEFKFCGLEEESNEELELKNEKEIKKESKNGRKNGKNGKFHKKCKNEKKSKKSKKHWKKYIKSKFSDNSSSTSKSGSGNSSSSGFSDMELIEPTIANE